jgi:hypothetical protein
MSDFVDSGCCARFWPRRKVVLSHFGCRDNPSETHLTTAGRKGWSGKVVIARSVPSVAADVTRASCWNRCQRWSLLTISVGWVVQTLQFACVNVAGRIRGRQIAAITPHYMFAERWRGEEGGQEGRVKSSLPQAVLSARYLPDYCPVVDGVVGGSLRHSGCNVVHGERRRQLTMSRTQARWMSSGHCSTPGQS